MFKISQSETYFWPVKVEIPVSGGKHDTVGFDAEFKRLPQSRIKEIRESEDMTDLEFCKEILVGWKDVADKDGEPLPFSATNRDVFLDIANVAKSTVKAFVESQAGVKIKN